MPIIYGIAGTEPLQQLDKSIHIMLEEAVQAKWDQYADVVTTDPLTVYPPASRIWFNHAWNDDHHDMAITFRKGQGDKAPERRSLDWSVVDVIDYVIVHVWARSNTVESEPSYYYKMIRIFMKLIEAERDTLIPNVVFNIASDNPASDPEPEPKMWHHQIMVRVRYKERRIVVP